MAIPPTVATAPDLATIIKGYSEVTEKLKQSHELLTQEVSRLRRELHHKNRELRRRERLAALGEMAAGVAHEIRNPLGGIDLYTSLLERDLLEDPEKLDIVRKVRVGVRNMENIVGDILAFAGPAEPNRRRVLLGVVLDSVLTHAAPSARALEAAIDVDPKLARIELLCDAGQIERALLNLVLNALDAAGHGGRVWVRADTRPVGNRSDTRNGNRSDTRPVGNRCHAGQGGDGLCRISVEDDGPGVAAELRQRVFDPFFTTKESGTGLGLAIVHRIAESNGGHVRVGAREGGGAVFELSLPLNGHSVGGMG